MLTVGIDALPSSITEVMPAALDHFGVALPPYARVSLADMTEARSWPLAAPARDLRRAGPGRDRPPFRGSCSSRRPSAARAYADRALPIGHGQTISQPFMVATICALLRLDGEERVLDVGTGSGYQAAVLAELAAEVVTVERVPELAERRARTLAQAPATSGSRCASATERSACPSGRRSRGSPSPPPLRPSRRRCTTSSTRAAASSCPVASRRDQRLQLIVRGPDGPGRRASVPCRFVPLLGAAGFEG